MLVSKGEKEKIKQLRGIRGHLLGDDSRACPGRLGDPMGIELLF